MQPASVPLEREMLASTPSFRKIGPDEWPALEEEPPRETSAFGSFRGFHHALDGAEEYEGDDGGTEDFEFAALSGNPFEGLEPISADEIFAGGRILPFYPIFNRGRVVDEAAIEHQEGENQGSAAEDHAEKPARIPLRKLMMEDWEHPHASAASSSAASSDVDELEGIPAESYCLWTPGSTPPSPNIRRRSHSTGDCSSSKRWRLRDLVIGRSQSDGRKKFLFLAPLPPHPSPTQSPAEKTRRNSSADGVAPARAAPSPPDAKAGKGKGGARAVEMDIVTAHRLYYSKGGAAAEDRRRSYLPYRRDLVGFFGGVNGAGRTFQPHPI